MQYLCIQLKVLKLVVAKVHANKLLAVEIGADRQRKPVNG